MNVLEDVSIFLNVKSFKILKKVAEYFRKFHNILSGSIDERNVRASF